MLRFALANPAHSPWLTAVSLRPVSIILQFDSPFSRSIPFISRSPSLYPFEKNALHLADLPFVT